MLEQEEHEEQEVQLKLSTHKRALPEIVMVKEFVEENHMDIADTIHDEAEQKKVSAQAAPKTISVEELRKIEY